MRCIASINKWLPAVVLLGAGVAFAAEPVGTGFTYQGQLKGGGMPLNDSADFQFVLWNAESGGAQVGSMVPANNVGVVNGLFTAPLDFGAGAIAGDARWLEISVRSPAGSGAFTPLNPRQPVTAAPVAAYALAGPGSGGFWAASGNNIYNTNNGDVGIGTNPSFRLHLKRLLGTPSGPPTTLGLEWKSIPGGASWCYLAVNANDLTEGTDFFRETNTPLRFSTKDQIVSTSTTTQMVLTGDGNLGIGTPFAEAYLDVRPAQGTTAREILKAASPADGSYGAHDVAVIQGGPASSYTGTVLKVESRSNDSSAYALLDVRNNVAASASSKFYVRGDGHVGIGTSSPAHRLEIHANETPTALKVTQNGAGAVADFRSTSTGAISAALFVSSASTIAPTAVISNPGNEGLRVYGTASVDVLEITGADVAEKFPVSGAADAMSPGTVMEIDPEHPGKLRIARGAYNRRVAGVVSGAGDIPTGTILGNMPDSQDAPPIALSGRVWARCDATQNAVHIGDMLTTSDTPGHAMAADDFSRAHGAVIGKAMTPLARGEAGLVLVLVNLQ